MLANVDRIDGDIAPGGMDVPLFHDATTDTRHGLRVLWADSLRWQGFMHALERPDRPDLSDPESGGPARPAACARRIRRGPPANLMPATGAARGPI